MSLEGERIKFFAGIANEILLCFRVVQNIYLYARYLNHKILIRIKNEFRGQP